MIVFLLRIKEAKRVFTDGKEVFVACVINDRLALREPTNEEAQQIAQKIYNEGL
jgi:hypothetical protein